MTKLEQVLNAFVCCIEHRCEDCYAGGPGFGIECRKTLKRDALDLLRSKDNNVPAKWINVKDRLPEEDKYVLAWEKQGFTYCDALKNGVWRIGAKNGAIATHWMPLPEPPMEEKNDDEYQAD